MAFDPNRWTIKTSEAVNTALESARAASNPEVTPDHLLAALLAQPESAVGPLLQKVGVDPRALRSAAEERLGRLPRAQGGESGLSRALRDVVERADKVRTDLHDEYLSTEHLLLAMAESVGA
jgi:ATP-dependent Clp protease ATP-binding subunit ClpB